jgi:hypothetical protein
MGKTFPARSSSGSVRSDAGSQDYHDWLHRHSKLDFDEKKSQEHHKTLVGPSSKLGTTPRKTG